MHLTFGSVATLAAKFDRPVARIDPSDATATLGRIDARKVRLSVVANATYHVSVCQDPARLQLMSRPVPQTISPENGRTISSATTRPPSESTCLPQQVTVAVRRDFFQKLALESTLQPPARLDRSEIPKRLGTGMHPGAVVWVPMAHGNVPSVDNKPPRDPVIDRPQAREPGKSGKRPRVMAPRLRNIVQNPKALLQKRPTSLMPANESTTVPAKFSMPRSVSSQAPLALNDGDSGRASPIAECMPTPSSRNDKANVGMLGMLLPSEWLAAPQSGLEGLYGDPSKCNMSTASSEESLSPGHSTVRKDSSSDSAMGTSDSDSEADILASEPIAEPPIRTALPARELRFIQRELFEMARKYPNTECGTAAWNLHSANLQMVNAVGARTTYNGAVRLMPGIRSMSTVRTR